MKKHISRIVAGLLLLLFALPIVPVGYAQYVPGEARKFLVTAYYSPLPNQDFYITGSYEGDIRLNGRGTNGADGTEVFEGMLAAPKTYAFGTRIRFPGLGVGEVHDRGGAIIAHADYDRIDVWMGHGEEGLSRAVNWGARMLDGEVYWTPHQAEPGLDFNWVNTTLSDSFIAKLKQKAEWIQASSSGFATPVSPTQTTPIVTDKTPYNSPETYQELQVNLTLFGYYHGPIDSEMNEETKNAVFEFQKDEQLVLDWSSAGAGNYGPKTAEAIKNRIHSFNFDAQRELERLEANRLLLVAGLGKNADGQDVEKLQLMLWELGYYPGPISRKYDEQTIDAVFAFQVERGVLDSPMQAGAGYFGDQTHEALIAAINEKIEHVSGYPKEKQSWMPANPILPQLDQLSISDEQPERKTLLFDPGLNTKVVQGVGLSADLKLNDRGSEVIVLQNLLIKEGVLADGLNTGYYGAQTQSAVLAFQIKKGIVASESDDGAGLVGPKTRGGIEWVDVGGYSEFRDFVDVVSALACDYFLLYIYDMTIKQALQWGHEILLSSSDSARLDVELILSYLLRKPTTFLLAHNEEEIGFWTLRKFRRLVEKRKEGVPVAYLIGHKEFYFLDFEVNHHVLVPRPDTEVLVEGVIEYLNKITEGEDPYPRQRDSRIASSVILLDVGTGSGCIPISILKNVEGLIAVATDISRSALRVAKRNAKKHGVADRLTFLHSNLLEGVPQTFLEGREIVVTANLPYIPTDFTIHPSTKYEPDISLYGGEDGMEIYKRLMKQLQAIQPKVIFLELFEFQIAILANQLPGYELKRTETMTGEARLLVMERAVN